MVGGGRILGSNGISGTVESITVFHSKLSSFGCLMMALVVGGGERFFDVLYFLRSNFLQLRIALHFSTAVLIQMLKWAPISIPSSLFSLLNFSHASWVSNPRRLTNVRD